MKKLLDTPGGAVREMLEGLCDLHPGLALLAGENVVVRADLPPPSRRPVALVSGGGSGHEPAHAGYVGNGMLTAAVAGEVFTSPSVDAVLAALHATAGPAGAVLIVKNYTGDRLNFGLAAELARREGIPVEEVVVADDVALRDLVSPSRRRGIAGTVLVHKVAGAVAQSGGDLAAVAAAARATADDVGTMGVALGACTVPAVGRPGFDLGPGEIEIGLGIHGEQGIERTGIKPASELVERLLGDILADRRFDPGRRVALLVNGLGGTPPMELAVVSRLAIACLRRRGLSVERAWAGSFLTALEMPGVSLSVLAVDDERLAALDASSTAPAWPGGGTIAEDRRTVTSRSIAEAAPRSSANHPAFAEALLAVAEALEKAEPRLTDLDSRAGDGDLGLSMVRAAEVLRSVAAQCGADASAMLAAVAGGVRRAVGGSSGPLYAVALLRAARALPPSPDARHWGEAFRTGVDAARALGGATPGDRTMIDALVPAVSVLDGLGRQPADEVLRAAARAAREAADATADLVPRLGRASYMGTRVLGVPDPGAVAVALWLTALADHFGD